MSELVVDISTDQAVEVCAQALKDKNWSLEQIAAIEYIMLQFDALGVELLIAENPVVKGL